jgi:GNAT superfamily N-acetyltransferase
VVGFASLGPDRDDSEIGELYAIYVLPPRWGGGAGRALMAEAVDRLRSNAFREARLWVLADNPRARAFYERSGWSLAGEAREETMLDTTVHEVQYRIDLAAAADAA